MFNKVFINSYYKHPMNKTLKLKAFRRKYLFFTDLLKIKVEIVFLYKNIVSQIF